MKSLKKILIFVFGLTMVLGVTPAFADSAGTNNANVTVGEAVSILVTGNADFGVLTANNMKSGAQSININSTSNVPVNVNVKASNWNDTGMPISAMQFGTNTPITTDDQLAITNLAVGEAGLGSGQNVNMYMQVPFGSLAKSYQSTVTWTASKTA